jgi:hypothetical protein
MIRNALVKVTGPRFKVERSQNVSAPDAPLTFAFLTVSPFIGLLDGRLLYLGS